MQAADFLLSPIGDVFTVKACDFCDGEKKEPIPYADELQRALGGIEMPKELNIGFNGCGMACYGAVMDDIGIVFRKGKFDLFFGGNLLAEPLILVSLSPKGSNQKLFELLAKIVDEYKQNAHPNERLFKYFKRVKQIQGYSYQDIAPGIKLEPAPCGD